MTLEVRQLVIRSELDNGKGAKVKTKGTAGDDAGQEPGCAGTKSAGGGQVDRRARERQLREMLERLGER